MAALGHDPHVGEWRHEIFIRTVYTLGSAILLACVLEVKMRALRNSYDDYLYPPLLGLFFALPESLLRRSWKMGLLSWAMAIVAAVAGYQVSELFASANAPDRRELLLLCLGGALGLSAGIGARSFLAALLGLLMGHGGGFLSYFLYMELRNNSDWHILIGPMYILVILFLMVLPLSLASGLAVCLGVRLSRRGKSPDVPAPHV